MTKKRTTATIFHVVTMFACQGLASAQLSPQSLHDQASAAYKSHDYANAETLSGKALDAAFKNNDQKAIATILSDVGTIYFAQDKFADAEEAYKRALKIKLQLYGPNHPSTISTRDHLVALYKRTGRVIGKSTSGSSIANDPVPGSLAEAPHPQPRRHLIKAIYRCPSEEEVSRFQTVMVAEKKALLDLTEGIGNKHGLSPKALYQMMTAGYNLVELSDGLLLATTEDLDENTWRPGFLVVVSEHPVLRAPACALTVVSTSSFEKSESVNAKLIAVH